MSVVLPSTAPDRLGSLPLLIGLAAAEAIENLAPGVAVRIKWPNDLWIEGRKVGGILCEASGGRVVGGVGINVGIPPEDFDVLSGGSATSLETEAGTSLRRHELAHAVVRRIEALIRPESGALPSGVLVELARRDGLAGLPIATETAGDGVGAGIGEDGALLLARPDGSTHRVVAGSVRLR